MNAAQLAAELALVRWPLQPLLDICDLSPSRLALLLGVPASAVRTAARQGLSDAEADLWATRAGYHPLVVWGWAWVDATTAPAPQATSTTARITADLRARIDRGDLRPGDPLPSARELAEEWAVTTATVVRAIKVLHREGRLVAGRRGHRTLVAPPHPPAEHTGSGDAEALVSVECRAPIEPGAEHFPHDSDRPRSDAAWCCCDRTVHQDCCQTARGVL